MALCENPPCEHAGPFRYCPIKGCGWMEEQSADEVVMAALKRAVEDRRNDREFMDRLRRNIEKHGALLERLAVDD